MRFLKNNGFSMVILVLLVAWVTVGAYRDADLDWQEKRVYIPVADFNGIATDQLPGVAGLLPAQSLGVANAAMTEVATYGIAGMLMATADDVRHVMPWPNDLNPNYALGVRIIYGSTSGDDDGGVIWKFHSVPVAVNTALTDLTGTGVGGTAGHKVITFATDGSTTQYAWRPTAWDTVGYSDVASYNKDKLFQFAVELDADGDAAADEIFLLGVEFAYVPKRTIGSADRRRSSFPIPGTTLGGVNKGITLDRK